MNAAVTNVKPAKPNTIAAMTTKKVLTPSKAELALAMAAASSLMMMEVAVDRSLGNMCRGSEWISMDNDRLLLFTNVLG